MKHTKKPDIETTNTTILTQLGIQSCIPKLARGESKKNPKQGKKK